MKRLNIAGSDVFLDSDVVIPITYSAVDVRDITKRSATFSKSFDLKGTALVDELFSFLFDVQTILGNYSDNGVGLDFNPLKKYNATLYDGETVVIKGYIRLINITNIDGKLIYNCNLYGSYANIYNEMAEDLVNILSPGFDVLDLNDANVFNSQNHALEYPFFIGFIDKGQNKPDWTYWKYNELQIFFRIKKLFQLVLSHYNYTYTSNFIDNDNALKAMLLLPNQQVKALSQATQDYRQVVVTGVTEVITTGATSTNNYTGANILNTDPTGSWVEPTIPTTIRSSVYNKPLLRITSKTKDNLNAFDLSNYKFKALFSATYKINVSLTVTIPTGQANIVGIRDIIALFYKNGIIQTQKIFATNATAGTYSLSLTGDITIDLKAGDTVRVMLSFYEYQNGTYVTKRVPGTYTITDKAMTITQQSVDGDNVVSLSSFLPSLKMKDFFLGFVKMFNLQIDVDKEDERHLIIEPFYDFYTTNYIDVSQMLQRNNVVKTEPLSEVSAKKYIYKYTYEDDYYNKLYKASFSTEYGQSVVSVNSDFATGENVLQLPFAHSPASDPLNQGVMIPSLTKNDGVNVVIFGSSLCRIYGAGTVNIACRYELTNGTFSNSSMVSISEIADYNSSKISVLFDTPELIYFKGKYAIAYPANNLFTKYTEPQLSEFIDINSRLITAKFVLSEDFINEFSFRKLVMIDNTLFRVNKIIDYKGSDTLTDVELLKVIKSPPRTISDINNSSPSTERYVEDGGEDNVFVLYPFFDISSIDSGLNINQGPAIFNNWTLFDGGLV